MGSGQQGRDQRHRSGITLLELMVVVGLMTIVFAVTLPGVTDWLANQRAKGAARSVADLLSLARSEAMRTGDRQVVFFGDLTSTDPSGNPVQLDGQWVPVLLIDDGPPATANCAIDAGEEVIGVLPEEGLGWGVTWATLKIDTDSGGAPFDPDPSWDGATFDDPVNAKVNWLMFGPDGIPVTFTGTAGGCGTVGTVGSGGGGLYVTNTERDYAVVLTPLGGVRLHSWNAVAGGWSN